MSVRWSSEMTIFIMLFTAQFFEVRDCIKIHVDMLQKSFFVIGRLENSFVCYGIWIMLLLTKTYHLYNAVLPISFPPDRTTEFKQTSRVSNNLRGLALLKSHLLVN